MLKRLSVGLAFAAAAFFAASVPAGATVIFDSPLQASADNPAPPGSHGALGGPLGPGGAVGGTGGPFAFIVPFNGTIQITVTDCCRTGDVYQVFLDGVSLGDTTPVELDGSFYTQGVFEAFVTAGLHAFDIEDILLQYLNVPSPFGGATVDPVFSPAGLEVTITETPEPETVALTAVALLGLFGFAAMRRRSQI